MKKLVFLILFFVFLSFPAYAQVQVITPNEITCFTGETYSLEILIKNQQDFQDDFLISVFPSVLEGVHLTLEKYYLSIPPNSEKTTRVFISIPDCIKEFTSAFSINVKSMKTNLVQQKNVYLNVKGKAVCLTGLTLDKKQVNPEETISIEVSLTNPSEAESPLLTLKTVLKDPSNNLVRAFEDKIEKIPPQSTQRILHTYTFGKYASPGNYKVEVSLLDSLNKIVDSTSETFQVNAIYTNEPEKSTTLNVLSSTVRIRIKNEGNAPTPPFYVSESLPLFAKILFQPETKPDKEETVGNSVIYYWYVEKIEPGKEITIVYRISLVNVWILILCIIFLSWVGYRYAFTPAIVKKSSYVGRLEPGKEITISLEVKNKSRHSIHDVTIKDFVPSILKLVGKFDTLRPKLKKTSAGVYLTWKLDSLKPKEERILTYRVKPALEIAGVLNLPKAKMIYLDKKKTKRKSVSKTVSFKPKEAKV